MWEVSCWIAGWNQCYCNSGRKLVYIYCKVGKKLLECRLELLVFLYHKNVSKTVVAQWAKAPGIHCYVAGSIPAVTPRYCTKKIEKCSLKHKKNKGKKTFPRN